ncbi:immunoglobulin domain-containing protein [Roseibacillus persicicus]|uniref:immunoglobulin domain-containing protein n=1 Tax=Roseibacillus persicicus TaxID=454148 RepID=UPI00398B9BCE
MLFKHLSFSILAYSPCLFGGTITTSLAGPIPQPEDVSQLAEPNSDTGNIDGSGATFTGQNDGSTYVADDRTSQGQTFTTTSPSQIATIWVKNPYYIDGLSNGTFSSLTDGSAFTVRIHSVSGPTLTLLHSEVATMAESNGIPGGGGWAGSDRWLRIALDAPVSLPSAGLYAFDLTSVGPYFELAGLESGPYTGGAAYTTAAKGDLNTNGGHGTGDRTFLIDIELTTPVAPVLLEQPTNFAGNVGGTVTLSLMAGGNPSPSVQWQKSADGITGWIPVVEESGSTLSIPSAPVTAAGFYRAIASNSIDSVTTDVIEVSLSYPAPTITSHPSPLGFTPGDSAMLEVSASGLGKLSFQWQKYGVDLPGETNSTLSLSNLKAEDAGIYSVVVSDDAATGDGLPASILSSRGALLVVGNLDDYQSGLTYRLYDIREQMTQLYPLVPGQTPNIDEARSTVDWTGSGDFSSYQEEFLIEVLADLYVPLNADYEFRLTSSNGANLCIDDILITENLGENDPAVSSTGSADLTKGTHPVLIRFFHNKGTPRLSLEWKPVGATGFETIPCAYFLTSGFVTRVVAPGKKEIITPGDGTRPGSGQPLTKVHPEWQVKTIHPTFFNPKVGAMAVHPDGRLFITTFEPNQNSNSGQPTAPNGRVFALANFDSGDPEAITVTEVANGLFEPAGMALIDGVLHVTERLRITRLLDSNNDGFYETHETVGSGWISNNYHHFHFGLIEKNGFTYSTLSTSIIFRYNGLNGPNPPNRGTLVRTNLTTGQVDYLAGGLRTPNGIGLGPDGDIFQTDNQGSWQPASRLNHLQEGHFYGHYNNPQDGGTPSLFSEKEPTAAAVYLPQNEISNSPTQPLLIPEGQDFAGDMLLGELTLGGIRRVSLEKVAGEWQGAVYRFTQGFEAGVHRIEWARDGSLFVGCIGATGNWSWNGTQRGLQRLVPKPGAGKTFEIDRVEATPTGFRIKYTKPVPAETLNNPANFEIRQWSYAPSQDYGGAKIDETDLPASSSIASRDRKSVELIVPGLKAGYIVYLKSDIASESGDAIWSSEAWYTLNTIPSAPSGGPNDVSLNTSTLPENSPTGTSVGILGASHDNTEEAIEFSLPADLADNRYFSLEGDSLTSARAFDYEKSSSYTIIVRATDESGLSVDRELQIAIGDVLVENAPTRVILSNAMLAPDQGIGDLVGRFVLLDSDLGDMVPPTAQPSVKVAPVLEEFSYANGAALSGENGGNGFSGNWSNWDNSATILSSSLSYADSNGHQIRVSGGSATALSPSRNFRELARPVGADGTTVYFSVLVDPVENSFFWGLSSGAVGRPIRIAFSKSEMSKVST